ncbi:type IV pilus secretin PilQ, partial [Vibrio parahaemolyticus]|nr:type IV pilus secretin PilQ [Vibrio parahaemolyticus]MBE4227601.1 type IV pilus secretin PilQ [Vibrio parahaemolyticus]MBE4449720.1 type IV pilus secretin PilQ [Vibrio parahaemolyticus]
AEIISSPRLITTNKKPAYIEQGTEIPYLESSSSGATSVTFKKAVLSLKVTPQITPDNRLVLDLSVTQDRPGKVVKTGTGEAM